MRSSTPESLHRQLDRELDRIVQRALRKEPERRHATAQDLRRELERHLDRFSLRGGEAIVPRERARAFVARIRPAVTVALVLSVTAAALGALWLRTSRLAEDRELLARQRAQNEQLADAFENLLRRTKTAPASGEQLRSSAVLDSGVRLAMGMLDQDPAAAGELMASLGGIYDSIGEKAKARRWRSSAESIQRSLAGPSGADIAGSATAASASGADSRTADTVPPSAPEGERLVGPNPTPAISVSGTCSQLRVRVTAATPGGVIALATSTAEGPTTVNGGPCPGVELHLRRPQMVAVTVADPIGEAVIDTAIPRKACRDSLLQAVDKTRCEPSPVVALRDAASQARAQGQVAQVEVGAAESAADAQKMRQ